MTLDISLKMSFEWMKNSSELLDEITFDATHRKSLVVGLLHLSLEHQKGIHVLVSTGVYGSALTLIRPQFETLVRGLWFNRCATDKQVEEFIAGREPPKIGPQIDAIEETDGYKGGALGKHKKEIWKPLNDYTHGGIAQVRSRVTVLEVANRHTDKHLSWLLLEASRFSLLAGMELAGVVENHSLAKQLHLLFQSVYEPNSSLSAAT